MALVIGFLKRRNVCRNEGIDLQLLLHRLLCARKLVTGSSPATTSLRERKVVVFWDLNNKPPKGVTPFKAAIRLKEVAAKFGYVEDVIAYGNYYAFKERKKRKLLDELAGKGDERESPYVCGVCGLKEKSDMDLKRHFKMLHASEQSKQTERFLSTYGVKVGKYKMGERGFLSPAFGYRLEQDLRKAGVSVRTVQDEPQAAQIALKEHMMKSINKGIRFICLVSDNSVFSDVLKEARSQSLRTVVIGNLKVLREYADASFSWAEVASGIAAQEAKLLTTHWKSEHVKDAGGLSTLDVQPYVLESRNFTQEHDESEFDTDSDCRRSEAVDKTHEKDERNNPILDFPGSESGWSEERDIAGKNDTDTDTVSESRNEVSIHRETSSGNFASGFDAEMDMEPRITASREGTNQIYSSSCFGTSGSTGKKSKQFNREGPFLRPPGTFASDSEKDCRELENFYLEFWSERDTSTRRGHKHIPK